MSDSATMPWRPVGAWAGIAAPGRHGRDAGPAGLQVVPREGLGLATIIARAGRTADLTAIMVRRFGLVPPRTPKAVVAGDTGLVWSGPEQWLLVSERRDLVGAVAAELATVAAVSDQSDARAVLRLTGSSVRQVLAKGCLVDLHPRAFGPGDAALTSIAHVGVQIWQIDEAPTYDLTVARSFAASFWTWLAGASAEFGSSIGVSDLHSGAPAASAPGV